MPSKKLPDSRRQGLILVIVGLLLIASVAAWRFWEARVLSFTQEPPVAEEVRKSSPNRITIPVVKLDLPVEEGVIESGVWQVSKGGASHLVTSANPGEKGNIVIYGHNRSDLFGPIHWLEVGGEIKVTNQDGEEFVYRIEKTAVVSPDNLFYVLPNKEEEILTLYTCTGFLDSKRYIVVAKPLDER